MQARRKSSRWRLRRFRRPLPSSLTITTTGLPGGPVGTAYSAPLASTGGTGIKSWNISAGTLPAELTLDPSTGVISGTPTTAGTLTVTLRVQDSGSPQQSAQKAFNLMINDKPPPPPPPSPSSCETGATNCLIVSNAPASVGDTFAVDARVTSTGVGNGVFAIVWGEISDPNPATFHAESLMVGGSTNANGQMLTASFAVGDRTNSFGWTCVAGFAQQCNGLTISRTAGAATFSNVVLTDSNNNTPPITLNGTLTFTPF